MYKIYINETPLILTDRNSLSASELEEAHQLVARYPGLPKMILNYVDMLEKSQRFSSVVLYAEDFDQLVQDFKGHFTIIEAAGGIVREEHGDILAIFRRGCWDLPKGKIDPGESSDAAALREVEEETGVQKLLGKDLIYTSYHTYREKKNRRILKKTYWYTMVAPRQALVPQTEEDIEQAIWVPPTDFLTGDYPKYKSIKDVLEWYLQKG